MFIPSKLFITNNRVINNLEFRIKRPFWYEKKFLIQHRYEDVLIVFLQSEDNIVNIVLKGKRINRGTLILRHIRYSTGLEKFTSGLRILLDKLGIILSNPILSPVTLFYFLFFQTEVNNTYGLGSVKSGYRTAKKGSEDQKIRG